jgi:hypothetical protein
MQNAIEPRRHAFSIWLRTGRWPRSADRREFKFNPWHDPKDGRFTFAGAGRHFAPGSSGSANRHSQHEPPIRFIEDPTRPPFESDEEVDAWAARLFAEHDGKPGYREAIEARRQLHKENLAARPRDPLAKVSEFAVGLGEGLYDVGKGAATGLYSLATTNPITSVQNFEFGLAQMVDGAIVAEDTPAYVHLTRAADSIAKASAHDIGYALGSLTGNVGLAAAPGAVITKVSSVSRVGTVSKVVRTSESASARFGTAVSTNYRATFFDAHPALKNKVVVHHAVEKQVLDRFPGTVAESEMHSLDNLRGVPNALNSDLHLSKLRTEWNQFYKTFEAKGVTPTKEQLLQKATEIDAKYGSHFNPPR